MNDDGAAKLANNALFSRTKQRGSTLLQEKNLSCRIDLDSAVYSGAHDEVSGKTGGRLLRWRLRLFALFRNSVRAVDLFNLPPPNFQEIGRQIEI